MIRIFSSACLLIRFSIRKDDGSAYHLINQSGDTWGFYLTSVEGAGNYNMVRPLVGFKFSEKRVEKAEKIL
ncbi:hypothetical protein [Bacillus velezensis]|uniref:hypothetical protein n=1 Tax=Bacillus velezensis TaxID=492670 RepID=UPI001CCE12A8|nr:hypothetical protein [Bacillus velezensis]UBM47732.1 hypothetical protein LAZ98_10090 [Bacillus velezensis]